MPAELPAILNAFADLAPEGKADLRLDVTEASGSGVPALTWLGTRSSIVPAGEDPPMAMSPSLRARLERLAAHDQLHRHERRVREGWIWLCGRVTVDGTRREVCVPLLSTPVRVQDPGAPLDRHPANWVAQIGDPELTALVTDAARDDLEDPDTAFGGGGLLGVQLTDRHLARFPDMLDWISRVVEAAGLPPAPVEVGGRDPVHRKRDDSLVAVVGAGLHVIDREDEPDLRRTLRAWAARPGLDATSMAAVYRGTTDAAGDPDTGESTESDHAPRSPLPLTAAQRRLVVRARHEALVVASGAPGTGKSHAVVAVAIDAVLRGSSVLVATGSTYAADVLAELLDRHPGPTPVLFGSGERRDELIDGLTRRLGEPVTPSEIDRHDRAVADAEAQLARARAAIVRSLDLEREAAAAEQWDGLVPALLADAPRLFDADADLDEIDDLLGRVRTTPEGWWSRWRWRRADRALRAAAGAAPDVPLGVLEDARDAARSRASAAHLATHGGVRVGPSWDRLDAAAAELRAAIGGRAALHDRLRSSLLGRDRSAVGALLNALRAGRGTRRRLLAELDPTHLGRGVPLWIGSLRDIEDLLPAHPAMFDLVLLDEASQIDQTAAAFALLRGRRAVVVGDPNQLRHVSFTPDAEIDAVLASRDLGHRRGQLDLRRSSAFDAAAASAPVTWLDEHHRSEPHLIEFSVDRFYRDRVRLLTRHPSSHDADLIDTVVVPGRRDASGVHAGQVDEVVARLEDLAALGATSVGVVTPFRAQADAIERAVTERLSLDVIERLGLRVGTVHAFQGSERDVLVVSLALDDDSPAGSRRFVDDPNLFNVMVTRARERVVVLTSQTEPTGLVADYLAWAEHPPAAPPAGPWPGDWAEALGAELRRVGHHVTPAYPVGHWHLDLVVGEGADAVGVETGVHPDGPDAHVERHLALRHQGWRIVDAFPSRWSGDAARAALELGDDLRA